MFKKPPPEEDPRKGPLSFKGHKFEKELPKIDALVLEQFFQDLNEFRKVAK